MGKIFLAVIVVLALIFAMPSSLANALEIDGTYKVYYDNGGKTCERELTRGEAKKAKNISGMTVITDADLDKIISELCFACYDTETVGGVRLLYGYSPKIGGGVWRKGLFVNLQIAVGKHIFVGSPLLKGWY